MSAVSYRSLKDVNAGLFTQKQVTDLVFGECRTQRAKQGHAYRVMVTLIAVVKANEEGLHSLEIDPLMDACDNPHWNIRRHSHGHDRDTLNWVKLPAVFEFSTLEVM